MEVGLRAGSRQPRPCCSKCDSGFRHSGGGAGAPRENCVAVAATGHVNRTTEGALSPGRRVVVWRKGLTLRDRTSLNGGE